MRPVPVVFLLFAFMPQLSVVSPRQQSVKICPRLPLNVEEVGCCDDICLQEKVCGGAIVLTLSDFSCGIAA